MMLDTDRENSQSVRQRMVKDLDTSYQRDPLQGSAFENRDYQNYNIRAWHFQRTENIIIQLGRWPGYTAARTHVEYCSECRSSETNQRSWERSLPIEEEIYKIGSIDVYVIVQPKRNLRKTVEEERWKTSHSSAKLFHSGVLLYHYYGFSGIVLAVSREPRGKW